MMWMDVEAVIVRRLRATLGVPVSVSTPADLAAPCIKITAATGSDDGVTDQCLVDVEAFAPTRKASHDLAENAREALLAMPGTDDRGDSLIDHVRTSTRPVWVDYRNPAVHRFVATYWVHSRLQ